MAMTYGEVEEREQSRYMSISEERGRRIKALVLLSGGLDSTLALRIMVEQGIELEALNFVTPFCLCTPRRGCRSQARVAADRLGIPLKVMGLMDEYIEVVRNPRYGYGRNLNPCIDCRILMFRKTKEYMDKVGASFIITGEVLGQRPKSQYKGALKIIEREAGLEGRVLRPLSAKLLEPTIPELEGIVNRQRLLAISGRSRKEQIQLAKEKEIIEYRCPAGGCLLTDPGFARRLKDLFAHSEEVSLKEINLLKIGRHFRLSEKVKAIVGRNKDENKILTSLVESGDYILEVSDWGSPTTLLRGNGAGDLLVLAARITARYSDAQAQREVKVSYKGMLNSEKELIIVSPVEDRELNGLRI